jgi:hypothetical protein
MVKKLLAIAVLALAFFALSESSNAQTVYFCEGVSNDGYPITESSVFNIGSGGGYVYVLTRLPYEIACRSVRYEIYRNGDYDNTIYLDTEKSWVWFWKQITFYKSGTYTVYVYDCFDANIASGSVKIQIR